MAPDDSADTGPDPDGAPAALDVYESDETAPAGTHFELYRDEIGDWRWRLVHRNGNIIADGSEGYARKPAR